MSVNVVRQRRVVLFRPGRCARCRSDSSLARLCRRAAPGRPSVPHARCAAPAARDSLRLPHALQDLGQPEVDLPPFHVDADHLHRDLVAQPVDPSGVLAAQHVRALDEPVVVVGHRRDVDHPFDEVLDQLDEQPERATPVM